MNAVHRLIGLFRDSPTYGRDRAALLSGFSIGTAGLLLNGAMLLLVLPLMLDPDDADFRTLTENLEFGQLLALILLGGATVFATLLIPLRLLTVFWGPRGGRYFDQIVLSGISPLRFVIGKATSQNLFLGLILFLLLPYLVLSLTLGGVNLELFLAGLGLVWLYCMALALVCLWACVHMNELLAAWMVISTATLFSILGCFPFPFQPFVMTPFPALLRPVYASFPSLRGQMSADAQPVFVSSALCMMGIICMSLLALHLGPLFGIIRENSTFGEVVRAGDSKRKHWFRLRLHIQRPSEIAFFYENRDAALGRNEGLVRWGSAFCGLLVATAAAYLAFLFVMLEQVATRRTGSWWAYEFHAMNLTIYGFAMALAVVVFSHAKNSTYLRIPFVLGYRAEVSRLDTAAFLLFAALAAAAALGTPYFFEQYGAAPNGVTLFPELKPGTQVSPADYARIAVEGTAVIAIAGLTVYALQRLACLGTWLKSPTFWMVAAVYAVVICVLPVFMGLLFVEGFGLRNSEFTPLPAYLMILSPLAMMLHLFHEFGPQLPQNASTVPFYVAHFAILAFAIFEIRRRGRKLRTMYLAEPARGTH